jgi:hypothetical protein
MGPHRILARYGPTLAIVACLVVLTLFIPQEQSVPAELSTGTTSMTSASAPVASTRGDAAAGTTPGSAETTAISDGVADGPSASPTATLNPAVRPSDCRPDGRMRGISRYMPPCVPLFTGNNGGATSRGVTDDSIIVARWRPQSDPISSSLVASAGVGDETNDIIETEDALVQYFNQHYETYGRKVVMVDVEASGATSNDQAMRADAVRIAKDIGAFAVIASGEPMSFDREAVEQGLICIPCGLSHPQPFYDSSVGYAFGGYPPNEEYYRHMAEYIGKRLAGRPAQYAGDETFKTQPRKFGLIWVENSPLAGGPPDPDRKAAVDFYRQELARYGVVLEKDVGYQYDLTRIQEQATNVIVQMKAAGVTNLAFVGDALSPIFLTREATRQAYYPEWFVTGNLATDNVILGRQYDQSQWQHAFGIGFVFTLPEHFDRSLGYLEYKSVRPDGEPASGVATYRQPYETLFTGIHMAGAQLTRTRRQGATTRVG